MNVDLKIPWKQYALITELTERLNKNFRPFGKTVLVKMIYLLQEAMHIDCGYDFEFYTYGPFTAQILNDLDYVGHFGGVNIQPADEEFSGYRITPGDNAREFKEKGKHFIDSPDVSGALTHLVDEFGNYSAQQLELRATVVYAEREHKTLNQGTPPEMPKLIETVKGVKPKFSHEEIKNAVIELRDKSYIQLS